MGSSQLPALTRRVFLNHALQALAAATVLPLPARAAGAPEESGPDAGPGAAAMPALEFFSAAEYAVMDVVGDTIIPPGGAFDLGAREAGLAQRIDHYLAKWDPPVAAGFRGALVFVEQQAPQLAGKPAPFSALSENDRTAVLEAMLRAGGLPAGVLLAVKFVCVSHFYTMDRTWKFTGYDGPMLLEDAR